MKSILAVVVSLFVVNARAQTNCPAIQQACTAQLANQNQNLRTLTGRLANNANINDGQITPGTVTPTDVNNDLAINYDTNNDGCVSAQEWNFRRNALGFSSTQTAGILNGIRQQVQSGITQAQQNCFNVLNGFPYNPGFTLPASVTVAAFDDNQISSIVTPCELNPNLYQTDCDCAQLPSTCRSPRYGATQACQDYLSSIQGITGCVFTATAPTAPVTPPTTITIAQFRAVIQGFFSVIQALQQYLATTFRG